MKRQIYGIFLFLLIVTGGILTYNYTYVFRQPPVALEQTSTVPDFPRFELVQDISQDIADSVLEVDVVAEYDPDKTKVAKRRPQIKLMWESSFHSEFFLNKNGEKWFGLFKDGDKYQLRPTTLKVKRIKDPVLYDLDVSTSDRSRSVFLVRDILKLQNTEIPTVIDNVTNDDNDPTDSTIKPSETKLDFNGMTYSLYVESPDNSEYPTIRSKLYLQAGETKQVLRYLQNGCNDCYWTLLWAGDLDLDGKLDLLLDLTHHYNVEDRVLFLSSQAEEGKLVKYIADFYNVGC